MRHFVKCNWFVAELRGCKDGDIGSSVGPRE